MIYLVGLLILLAYFFIGRRYFVSQIERDGLKRHCGSYISEAYVLGMLFWTIPLRLLFMTPFNLLYLLFILIGNVAEFLRDCVDVVTDILIRQIPVRYWTDIDIVIKKEKARRRKQAEKEHRPLFPDERTPKGSTQ